MNPKIWSHGTNLGYLRALLAKGPPTRFCNIIFWIVLRVIYDPMEAIFMVDFLLNGVSPSYWCPKPNCIKIVSTDFLLSLVTLVMGASATLPEVFVSAEKTKEKTSRLPLRPRLISMFGHTQETKRTSRNLMQDGLVRVSSQMCG